MRYGKAGYSYLERITLLGYKVVGGCMRNPEHAGTAYATIRAAIDSFDTSEIPDLHTYLDTVGLCGKLHSEGKSVDPFILAESFKAYKKDGVRMEFLSECYVNDPPETNILWYINSLYNEVCDYHLTKKVAEIVSIPSRDMTLEDRLRQIGTELDRAKKGVNIGEKAKTLYEVGCNTFLAEDVIGTVSTGYRSLPEDKPGDLVVIAGRPSMGKTALAVNMAVRQGEKERVLFVSIEMQAWEVCERACAIILGKPFDFRKISKDDIQDALNKLRHYDIYIKDSGVYGVLDIADEMAKCGWPKTVFIDYIQLMSGEGSTRDEKIASISRSLKCLAKSSNSVIYLISQLNRGLEHREDKRPLLSDLRESGSLEQDADKVVMVYRDAQYSGNKQDTETEIIYRKNRGGPTGTYKLHYVDFLTRFEEC